MGKLSFNKYRNLIFYRYVFSYVPIHMLLSRASEKKHTHICGIRLPVPDFFYLSFSCQIKHELEMCELRRYFENYCREIEAKYRHELEDTVLTSSRITRTLPAITRSFIILNFLVLRSRQYFFWVRLQLLQEYFGGL